MELSEEQKQKVVEFLKHSIPSPIECPICHGDSWAVTSNASGILDCPEKDGPLIASGIITPVIMLICDDCNYILLFNALKMGIVGQDKEKA